MSGIEGGPSLALVRALTVAALLSAFGSQVFTAWVLPKVSARVVEAASLSNPLSSVTRRSQLAASLLLPVWLLLQAADLAGTGRGLAALPDALLHTLFSHVLLAQLAAVLVALWAGRRRPLVGLALSTLALLLQAGHSHAWSMEDGPSVLVISECIHLLAAGAWLGGLLPLLVVVRGAGPKAGALAARWFSPLGKACVVGLVLSAGYQFWALIGGLPGLVGTPYGWVAGAKLGLLGVLFAFAVLNRYRLAPALLHDTAGHAGRLLVRAIAVQTAFGLATVLAAGILSQLPPAMHEQPVWPFPLRPSLAVMAEPELAAEVWTAVLWLSVAASLLLALTWRPLRRLAPAYGLTASAAVLVWFASPHLSLLLVEAYPTSYDTSPSGFAARSIIEGASLYRQHCVGCHGPNGRGDGPDAKGLAIPPADLTAAHLWDHADGELFWWLSNGMFAPDGTQVMPGYAALLSDGQRWALIDAVRARNAGLAWRTTGTWPNAVHLPQFSLDCPGRNTLTVEELRGQPLYLVFAPGTPARTAPSGTIPIVLTPGEVAGTGLCHSSDPTTWDALALATGETATTLAGARMIVDAAGWLRAFRPASTAAAWDDPGALSTAIKSVADTPLASEEGGHHHH